ncbi:zinc finger protein sens isoform X3 [Aedes albopictus]|uniref:C2h2-type zn-finger protein n=1 Tax=Aedes albopictus TaxID=7160 RepID=A0ABM1Z618_AEDAL
MVDSFASHQNTAPLLFGLLASFNFVLTSGSFFAVIMSKCCSIPGCRSQIRNTTMFSVSRYSSLAQWWTTTSWYDEVVEASDPRDRAICILHFREDQLDKSQTELRLANHVVPSINLPGSFVIQSVQENYKLPLPQATDSGSLILIYCRFCGKKQKCPLKNHLEDLIESEDLLQLCLGRGRFLEGFPNGVCDPCLQMLKTATSFIKSCEQAQEKLQKIFFGTSQQSLDHEEEDDEDETDYSFEMPEAVISLKEEMHSTDAEELDTEDIQLHEMRREDPLIYRQQTSKRTPKPSKREPKSGGEEPEEIRCTICDRTFNRKVALQAHMESIHEGRTFACPICGKVMGWKKTLQRHMKSHQENFQKHKCGLCDKSFSRPSHLRLHMVRHTGQKVRCALCQNGYRDNYKLGEHLTKAHNMDQETAKAYVQQAEIW